MTQPPEDVASVLERLPLTASGHWDTAEGREMALRSLAETRVQLCKGDMSDFALANGQFLASRYDLDLIVWQTAAKERIRWLSAQLAAANHLAEQAEAMREIVKLADELVNGGGLKLTVSNTQRLTVVENADKSDPHYRLCAALERLTKEAR